MLEYPKLKTAVQKSTVRNKLYKHQLTFNFNLYAAQFFRGLFTTYEISRYIDIIFFL